MIRKAAVLIAAGALAATGATFAGSAAGGIATAPAVPTINLAPGLTRTIVTSAELRRVGRGDRAVYRGTLRLFRQRRSAGAFVKVHAAGVTLARRETSRTVSLSYGCAPRRGGKPDRFYSSFAIDGAFLAISRTITATCG